MSNLTHAIRGKLKLALGLLFLALGAHAQESSRALQSLDFVALESNRVLITLTLSESAPEPVVFTIDKPARLSLDLPDTRVSLAERFKKVNVGNVRSVAAVEARGRTRVVVELGETAPHTLRVDGNKVYLQLDGATPAAATIAPAPKTSDRPGGVVNNIDFRRGEKGEGRVVVRISDPRAIVDVREEGGLIIATLKNIKCSSGWQ